MTRLSISNLAWQGVPSNDVAPQMRMLGIDGFELAPTAIWPQAPEVPAKEARSYAQRLRDQGLAISGIQSLLYGHPEFQIFDRGSWPNMRAHLASMIRLAKELGAHVAVFGSPRNRVRGALGEAEAHEICGDFLSSLLPVLEDCGVVLTLEPNAPEYGADYITRYADSVTLSDMLSSPWIQPQIDTGCLEMVNDDPVLALQSRLPAHIHVSAPHLKPPPGPIDHAALHEALVRTHYAGWIVLEMLQPDQGNCDSAVQSAQWLSDTYGTVCRG